MRYKSRFGAIVRATRFPQRWSALDVRRPTSALAARDECALASSPVRGRGTDLRELGFGRLFQPVFGTLLPGEAEAREQALERRLDLEVRDEDRDQQRAFLIQVHRDGVRAYCRRPTDLVLQEPAEEVVFVEPGAETFLQLECLEIGASGMLRELGVVRNVQRINRRRCTRPNVAAIMRPSMRRQRKTKSPVAPKCAREVQVEAEVLDALRRADAGLRLPASLLERLVLSKRPCRLPTSLSRPRTRACRLPRACGGPP